MVVLDTSALLFWTLDPAQLSASAAEAIERAELKPIRSVPAGTWLVMTTPDWMAALVLLTTRVQVKTWSKGCQGKLVSPIRYRSHSRAAPRPSLMAHTTRL